jgi:hypothetical protein
MLALALAGVQLLSYTYQLKRMDWQERFNGYSRSFGTRIYQAEHCQHPAAT